MQTVEAIVDADGKVKLLKNIHLPRNRRALITILDEEPNASPVGARDRLLAAIKKAQAADVFKDLDNPVEWQKNLRDEWE
ncbi:MAG: hypothetical protein UZ17_ACD001000651 [Acidobacteria bacterium OLB17]|nr:MAG: hypothetical protein UZ17_ACD001000651 [Acidobacteria bacterium OLB17]MCZ2390557.1 hypothetical protein [Acidobacteriota bacterium]